MILTAAQIRSLNEMVVPFGSEKEIIIKSTFESKTIFVAVPVYEIGSNTTNWMIEPNGNTEREQTS